MKAIKLPSCHGIAIVVLLSLSSAGCRRYLSQTNDACRVEQSVQFQPIPSAYCGSLGDLVAIRPLIDRLFEGSGTKPENEDLTATFIRIVIGSEKSELIGDTYNFGFNLRFLMLGQWASLVQQVECPREDQIRFLEIGVLLARRADRGDHDAFWALHLISDKFFPQLNTPWGSEGFLGNWKMSALYDRISRFEQFREMPPLSSRRPLGPVLNSQRITPMTVLRAGDIRIDLNNLRHKRVTGSAKQAASRKP